MKALLISAIYRPEIGGPATNLPSLTRYLVHLNHTNEIVTLKSYSWVRGKKICNILNLIRSQCLQEIDISKLFKLLTTGIKI
jgi:hypothetical protein